MVLGKIHANSYLLRNECHSLLRYNANDKFNQLRIFNLLKFTIQNEFELLEE